MGKDSAGLAQESGRVEEAGVFKDGGLIPDPLKIKKIMTAGRLLKKIHVLHI